MAGQHKQKDVEKKMLTLNVGVTAPQLAGALYDSDEELARCLDALSQLIVDESHVFTLAKAIVDCADNSEKVALWLKSLATAIEETSK
jgi:hypothetical protein